MLLSSLGIIFTFVCPFSNLNFERGSNFDCGVMFAISRSCLKHTCHLMTNRGGKMETSVCNSNFSSFLADILNLSMLSCLNVPVGWTFYSWFLVFEKTLWNKLARYVSAFSNYLPDFYFDIWWIVGNQVIIWPALKNGVTVITKTAQCLRQFWNSSLCYNTDVTYFHELLVHDMSYAVRLLYCHIT
jgi:hypothetical protein